MLPLRSTFTGHNMVGNTKMPKFKCDILSNFKHCDTAVKFLLLFNRRALGYFYPIQKSNLNVK